jgi:hypothetical protein
MSLKIYTDLIFLKINNYDKATTNYDIIIILNYYQ